MGFLFVGIAACAGAPDVKVNAAAGPVRGDVVEARTATVFAGACHYASEREMLGREAVIAWHVRGGSVDGVSLAGVDVVAAVASANNLEDGRAARSSVVYVGEGASEAQRAAAEKWLRAEHGAALGRIVAVKAAAVTVSKVGDSFEVKAGGAIEIGGAALENRACCRMPHELWYSPLARIDGRVVGSVKVFRQSDPDLARDFTYPGDNCAFVGTF